MLLKPNSCSECPLYTIGQGFAGTDGTGRNGVLLLGEALGEAEAEIGKPFQGVAGMGLTKMIHMLGVKRDDFLIANVVNCRPPENLLEGAWYEAVAIERCRHFLETTIASNPQIKTIVPMGNVPLFATLGVKGIKNFHGTVSNHMRWNKHIVPTMHPSYVVRTGFKEAPTFVFDLARAMDVARNGWAQKAVRYIEYPSVEELQWFVEEYEKALSTRDVWLSYDIETPYSRDIDEDEREDEDSSFNIIRASFAFDEGHAISFPWVDGFIELAKRALASPGRKLGWNSFRFDNPRLIYNGCTLNGLLVDGFEAFHFLYPDLPRGLGYVTPFFSDIPAWKHLSHVQQEFYSCVDADAALRNIHGIKRELDKFGSWAVFLRDINNIQPRFDTIHETGLGLDLVKRDELKTHYEGLRDNATVIIKDAVNKLEAMQGGIPQWARWVKKDEGYKGKPKDVRLWLKERPDALEEEAWTALGYQKLTKQWKDGVTETRWNKREEFNPNSPLQLLDYIRDRYGDKEVPRHKKTGKPTTGEEEIERLARRKKDRILELVVDAGQAGTLLSNFINSWPIGKDGRVHTILLNKPATFRLSSKNPNTQNFPHHSAEAKLMRQMVVPGAGWEYIVEADYTGIEAILVGWYARDEQYMRLAKMGVHDFFASHMMHRDGLYDPIDLSLSDSELAAALKACKKVANATKMPDCEESYRDGAKRTIHGTNYKMGPLLMHRNYPEVFTTPKVAEGLQGMYYNIFKTIEPWQDSVVEYAYRNHRVVNAFGYHRRFYNVKRWQFSKRLNKWELVWGDDAKKAIATIPQGSAAAIIRRAMMSDPFKELLDAKAVMLQIHDSLVCRARDKEMLEWVKVKLREAMCFPIAEMGGLVIPIEVKVGPNWGLMEG